MAILLNLVKNVETTGERCCQAFVKHMSQNNLYHTVVVSAGGVDRFVGQGGGYRHDLLRFCQSV